MNEQSIKGYECKHVSYVKAQDGTFDDLLAIKENIHYEDGTVKPNMRFIENYKKDIYITREGHRKHTDKTEWEDLNKLQKFTTTQTNQLRTAARALNNPAFKGSMNMLARSPYLYGTDIPTTVLAKQRYTKQWPGLNSLNKVAVLDIETDVVEGTEEILSISLTFKNKCFLTYTKHFLRNVADPEKKIRDKFTHYLGDYEKDRGIELYVQECETPGKLCTETIAKAHEWMPDFISIWNINFDLPKILLALEKENIDPAVVFSDPKIPEKYQYFKYKEGASSKLTASGKYMSLHMADRWHVVDCPASFFFIDAMCVYKKIRIAKGNEPSYSLDAILNKELGIRKLKFKEADGLNGIEWHKKMQSEYKIEYLIYNLFDCISVELLDEKTKDLGQTMTVLCGFSDYAKFPSQPRRTCDDLHFFCLENGKAIASTSDEMEDELDQYVLELTGWIVTFATHLVAETGLKVFDDLPNLRTFIFGHTLDLDQVY